MIQGALLLAHGCHIVQKMLSSWPTLNWIACSMKADHGPVSLLMLEVIYASPY
jgi:hypothetical protein